MVGDFYARDTCDPVIHFVITATEHIVATPLYETKNYYYFANDNDLLCDELCEMRRLYPIIPKTTELVWKSELLALQHLENLYRGKSRAYQLLADECLTRAENYAQKVQDKCTPTPQ